MIELFWTISLTTVRTDSITFFRELQHSVEACLMYRMVSTEVKYQLFSLEHDENVEKLT
jgi:hypothetical protein